MNAIAEQVAEELAVEFSGKVIDFKQPTPPTPEEEIERLATVHRKAEQKYRQRASDTRRAMKLTEAGFKADEKTEIARHKAAMELIAEKRANNLALSERAIAADERLAAYNRSAVEMLAGE